MYTGYIFTDARICDIVAIIMQPWTDQIDPTTIPDDVLYSEVGRRRGSKRATYTGGVYWRAHNPDTTRCRCRKCMKMREKTADKKYLNNY